MSINKDNCGFSKIVTDNGEEAVACLKDGNNLLCEGSYCRFAGSIEMDLEERNKETMQTMIKPVCDMLFEIRPLIRKYIERYKAVTCFGEDAGKYKDLIEFKDAVDTVLRLNNKIQNNVYLVRVRVKKEIGSHRKFGQLYTLQDDDDTRKLIRSGAYERIPDDDLDK